MVLFSYTMSVLIDPSTRTNAFSRLISTCDDNPSNTTSDVELMTIFEFSALPEVAILPRPLIIIGPVCVPLVW